MKSEMKILQSTFVRGIAGSENFLLNAIPGLIQKGHHVEFLMLYVVEEETTALSKILDEKKIAYHKFDISKRKLLSSLPKIARLMKRFDVTNSHLLHADFTHALAKMFFARKAVLVSGKHGYEEWYINTHGFDPKHKTKNTYWRTSKFAERFINRSFAISKGIQNLFIGATISKKDKIDLIYYGFEFDASFSYNEALRFGNPQLCIVGRLTAFKGHRFAIEALRILKENYPDIKLVIVGWGELENELKALVIEKGVQENVIFTGFQKNARDYMFTSDIILLPSISEGFGIVLAEAMSVKRPIVAFNVPSPSELLENGVSGTLVEPYDTAKYAAAITQLIENPAEQQKLAANAYEVLTRDYHLTTMIDKLEEFYKLAVREGKHKY